METLHFMTLKRRTRATSDTPTRTHGETSEMRIGMAFFLHYSTAIRVSTDSMAYVVVVVFLS